MTGAVKQSVLLSHISNHGTRDQISPNIALAVGLAGHSFIPFTPFPQLWIMSYLAPEKYEGTQAQI